MPKRTKDESEKNTEGEEQNNDPPPETRRTRSGRTLRTPAALLESKPPVRTPSRRTRRTVLQELPAEEEQNAESPEQKADCLVQETPDVPAEPEPVEPTERTDSKAEESAESTSKPDIDEIHQMTETTPVETVPASSETPRRKKTKPTPNVKQIPAVPLGKPKSGRVWKDRNKQRFSALLRDKPLCSSWEKKMQARREKDLVKEFTKRLKDEKAQKKEEKRKRREENLKRRAENERKAEIVQVIKNTAKIKRMKKKQLRKIEKRDTLALLQKSQKQNVKTKRQNSAAQDLT